MMKTYGILGSGDASDNVIEDALIEVGEDNLFIVGCPAKPSKSIARAIDWLIDNEVRYYIICKEKTPSRFVDNASSCDYRSEDDIENRVISLVKKNKGSLLLLWDNNNDAAMEKICFDAADAGLPILDLSNGLVSLRVEGGPTVEEEKHTPTAEIEVEPLSKEELQSLPIAMLHKIAKSKGLNPDLNYETTESLINRIMYADSINEGEQKEEDYLPPIDLGTFRIVKADAGVVTNGEATCMLTAMLPSGIIMSRPATPYEVKQLFGFEPTTL